MEKEDKNRTNTKNHDLESHHHQTKTKKHALIIKFINHQSSLENEYKVCLYSLYAHMRVHFIIIFFFNK